jgi:hypothetical protein
MTENTQLPPVKIAFVIDGKVVDILHTDDRLASIFLSDPVVVDVTDPAASSGAKALVGDYYDAETGSFSPVPPKDDK